MQQFSSNNKYLYTVSSGGQGLLVFSYDNEELYLETTYTSKYVFSFFIFSLSSLYLIT